MQHRSRAVLSASFPVDVSRPLCQYAELKVAEAFELSCNLFYVSTAKSDRQQLIHLSVFNTLLPCDVFIEELAHLQP